MSIADALDPITMQVPVIQRHDVPTPEAVLGGHRDELEFGGESGFLVGPRFAEDDVNRIAGFIKDHMIEVARAVQPEIVDIMQQTRLEDFHTIANFDQAAMLHTARRALPKEAVMQILAMPFFDFVQEAFGDFYLADEPNLGYDQITFRIVRPHRPEDVGYLHRDDWFWQHLTVQKPHDYSRVKVWVPIRSEPSADSLRVAVGSHCMEVAHTRELKDGKLHIAIDAAPSDLRIMQFYGEIGTPLFFNYHLLHVGSLNRGSRSRVSIETSIMYKNA